MSAGSDALIEVDDLHVAYAGSCALQGVSLQVRSGEVVAVLGANGAGKTTLLNAIAGLVRPTAGDIRLCGESTRRKAPAALIRSGLALVPEGRHLFPELSVIDNLRLGSYARHFGGWNLLAGFLAHRRGLHEVQDDLERVLRLFPRLRERASQAAGSMSGGEQQMLAIGRALMSRPRMLLLDEPSMGLAPAVVREILRLTSVLRQDGITLMVVEQNANQALRVADRAYVLANGRVILQGSAADLALDDGVRRAYLGAPHPRTAAAQQEVTNG